MLGQGQEPIAETALDNAFHEGGWVFLSNIHLTARWLSKLETKLDYYAEVYAKQVSLQPMVSVGRRGRLEGIGLRPPVAVA